MALRTKAKQVTNRRRTVAVRVGTKPARPSTTRPGDTDKQHATEGKAVPTTAPVKAVPAGANTYAKALRVLSSLTDHERLRIVRYNTDNFDLDRMRALLKKLGNPHEQFKSVHVAGTKGKGSTCAMTAAMLQACGYKVGLYTSPHLIDMRERIQINGEMIPQAELARLIRLVEPILARLKPAPTYFDVLTAIAFKYFAEQKVDIVVAETGLGGRLDSTNVLKPEVTAITSISKDHMQQLGYTLPKIAEEKAGIFKAGVPAVTVLQDPAVEAVLRQAAEKVGAPFDITGKTIEFSYRFESSRMLGPHNRICLTTPNSRFEHLAVPLLGEHQAINCGLALSILDRLKTRGFAINDNKAMEGLAKTSIAGRMETISTNPRIIVDGAHNAASVDAMLRAIGQHIPYDSMVVIFGCCADKDIPGMLERITCGADKVIFTKVDSVRTADPEELAARYIELYGKMAQVAPSLQDALAIANRAVTKEDLICITGSFYLVGEAKRLFTPKPA
ncbi:MAG TPA: folylpolyglutamate synthase/dihydrofolate synthase family protein [Tepidisphaeraceae bacterium]|nr:folylpolyglutamate synthase/dihydrofolate synthase family protein [Tepidisphaeraceae bacterium]